MSILLGKNWDLIGTFGLILRHSTLNINLCFTPSHCNVFGNDQADRIARRATNLNIIENIKVPKIDLMRQIKNKIITSWQSDFNQIPLYKIKDTVGHWDTSYNKNRKYETILACLRLNCVKEIHLIPRIEGTYPLQCLCDGSRLSLQHIFFECGYYIHQRTNIISMLQIDRKQFNVKSLLENNQDYCNKVIHFLRDINYIDRI